VESLAKPGGNLTGITNFEFEMGGKWLGLLKEIAPRVSRALLIFNPETAPYAHYFLQSVKLGGEASLAPVRNDRDIERTFSDIPDKSSTGVIVVPDLFTGGHQAAIITQAAKNQVPTIYPFSYFATNGGLLSYGVDTLDLFRRSASYVDRIFRGDKPKDLPIQGPTKFELVINLKTAKALGLNVPLQLQQRADEVIE
jgi:putative tryptophan/tyrosine transport system substrate-binding protein